MKQATNIHAKINTRGRDEQEKAYLFAGLYNTAHRLTRNERGAWNSLSNQFKRQGLSPLF